MEIALSEEMSPQARWPAIGTTISGLPPETWEAFHRHAEDKGITYREAMETAVAELAQAVQAGETIIWPHATGGKKHPIQIHHEAHDTVKAIVEQTKMRQNVVFLAAMERWMRKANDRPPGN
jgi:hypothetical protein